MVIPPALGYGTTGNSGIAPGETLVFVVDMLGDTGGVAPTTTTVATTTTAAAATTTTAAATTTTAAKTTTTTKPKK